MSTRWKLLYAPSERAAEMIGLMLIGIGIVIDAVTGPDYSNLLFYIPPLTYVAWFSGRRVGWTYVGLVAVIIIVVDLLESGESHDPLATGFNAFTRIATTAFVYWAVYKLRSTIVALRDANARLERLNEHKNLLFGVISHDLKGPFNALLGYAELLERSAERLPPERLKEYVRSLGDGARRAFDLLGNLLQWAQLQMESMALQPAPVAVEPLLERCAQAQRAAAAPKGVTLVVEPAPPGLHLHADAAAVQTVLRNLLDNAVKFTPPGGRVTISARAAAGMVEIAVADSGVGIPEQRLPELFEIAAQRTTIGTSGESGTGLGLILCRELVARSGGRIRVESSVGQGSRFCVTLPQGTAAEEAAAPTPEGAVAPVGGSPRAAGETG